ncbi:MAG: hypothetical protein ACREH8_20090, partial [Opitutaceae bacterium]
MRIQNYINGIEGVTAGGTSTVNVPINRRYHWLKAFVSGNNGSATTNPVDLLDYVRLIVNGVVMRDLSPAHIINIAKLNGVTPAAGETKVAHQKSNEDNRSYHPDRATRVLFASDARSNQSSHRCR